MSKRSVLKTLTIGFSVIAGAQAIALVPALGDLGDLAVRAAEQAEQQRRSVTDDGIEIVDERREPVVLALASPVDLISPETRAMAEDLRVEPLEGENMPSIPLPGQAAQSIEPQPVSLITTGSPTADMATTTMSAPTFDHDKLADIFAFMPADQAAAILTTLTPAESASVVSMMSGDAGAAVLGAMDPAAAAAIAREVLRTPSSRN